MNARKPAALTEEQLYSYKLHVRITFLETVLQQVLKASAQTQAEPKQALEAWASLVRSRTAGLHFDKAPAVVSDMLAAEYQETVDRFLTQLLE